MKALRPFGRSSYNLRARCLKRNDDQVGGIEDTSDGSDSSSDGEGETEKKTKVDSFEKVGCMMHQFDAFQENVKEEPDLVSISQMVETIRLNLEALQGTNKAKNQMMKRIYDELINSL